MTSASFSASLFWLKVVPKTIAETNKVGWKVSSSLNFVLLAWDFQRPTDLNRSEKKCESF